MEFAYEKHLLGCTRVWCIGALVHLVHWCNICEIDPFFNRGGSSGNTLETECTGYNRSKSGTFKWNLPMKCTWSGAPESGALVHLVHGCIICEINQFLSRGGPREYI